MSKHSYYRSQGYSTGEMLCEGKLEIWELPERVPSWLREPEEEDEKELYGFSGLSDEQIQAILKEKDEVWNASQNRPEPAPLNEDAEF